MFTMVTARSGDKLMLLLPSLHWFGMLVIVKPTQGHNHDRGKLSDKGLSRGGAVKVRE